MTRLGWVVRCPDLRIRSYPTEDRDSAAREARMRTACCAAREQDPPEWRTPPCPGGIHQPWPTTWE